MSSTYEALTVDVADHIAQVTLIGPGKGNAMGPAFWAELPVVFAELDADPDVRAIVLTGSGKNFTYGLDLAAMGGTLAGVMGGDGATAKPRADFHKHLKSMQQSITAVADCRTPTIHGLAATRNFSSCNAAGPLRFNSTGRSMVCPAKV